MNRKAEQETRTAISQADRGINGAGASAGELTPEGPRLCRESRLTDCNTANAIKPAVSAPADRLNCIAADTVYHLLQAHKKQILQSYKDILTALQGAEIPLPADDVILAAVLDVRHGNVPNNTTLVSMSEAESIAADLDAGTRKGYNSVKDLMSDLE